MTDTPMSAEIDFEAEGLLRGLRGKRREARRLLLAELAADGVPADELRRAAREGRLALLPVEREVAGGSPRYTLDQVAERSGLPPEFVSRLWRALGMALAGDGEVAYTEADLEAAGRAATLVEAGIPEEGVLEVARVLAIAMSQVAAANRLLVGEAFMRPGDTELDLARRFEAVARTLGPILRDAVAHALDVHLREQLRQAVIDADQVAAGRVAGPDEVTVCFADVVGFTPLGERMPTEDLGVLTRRLTELAGEVAVAPVRLVKLIGDAAMLVGPASEVLEAALSLVEASEAEDDFPLMRAGVAAGPALERAGDYYGRPVNLASRLAAVARPGSVLAAEQVREAVGEDGYRWSYARVGRLKGIEGRVRVFRCRRAGADAPPPSSQPTPI
jgi:adenylate cyclase